MCSPNLNASGIHAWFNCFESGTAAPAIININSGGLTQFFDKSTGGNAAFITAAGGLVDISGLISTGMTAGSIAGGGTYSLGSKELTVRILNG
jgi:hypothetical protein